MINLIISIQNDAQHHAALGAFEALLSEAETNGAAPTLELLHVLGGKRQLNVQQAKASATRF